LSHANKPFHEGIKRRSGSDGKEDDEDDLHEVDVGAAGCYDNLTKGR
jgi:hypothetical protein